MGKMITAVAALGALMVPAGVQANPSATSAHTNVHARTQAPKAKLSMNQARAIALRAAPGRVISGEYENEAGGWRYSFDIQQHHNVQEIGIDGQSGRIVENKSEGPRDRD